MKLSRSILNPANSLFSDFDHLFNGAFSRSLFPGNRRNPDSFGVYESEDAWRLRTDLPGFSKEDVNLRFENGVLHLAARHEESERSFHSSLERTFRVPQDVDPTRIEAHLENGVLEVVLPKREESKPETLTIEIK